MPMEVFLAFLAGVISIASPCVILVLPVIFAGSMGGVKRGLIIVAGMVASFVTLGLVSGALGSGLQWIRFLDYVAYILIIIFGLIMLEDRLYHTYGLLASRISTKIGGKQDGGVLGSLILGLSLGVVWLPCVGPILGTILTYVATKGQILYGGFLLGVYSLGLLVSMAFALIVFRKTGSMAGIAKWGKDLRRLAGLVILVVGVLLLTGLYSEIEVMLNSLFPPLPL
jgi:cytochrome c-type biogenesis protein